MSSDAVSRNLFLFLGGRAARAIGKDDTERARDFICK